jgi:hypothetical protein
MYTAMIDAFIKIHKRCEKTWEQPMTTDGMSVKQKAYFWYQHGEKGASSEAMFRVFDTGRIIPGDSHPYDPSDFKRCYGLLKMVPEWRARITEMKPVSKAWSNLVDNWDKLEKMYDSKDTAMYNLIKQLIEL